VKILIAPDSFKGSLTALQAAQAIENGIKHVMPDAETIKLPMADGGEGTIQSLVDATDGEIINCEVIGPLGNKLTGYFGLLGTTNTAVVEMAVASGLPLIPEAKRDPSKTTTYGTGELIKKALDHGAEKIIVGIGGSATTDAGMGMAQALGVKFLDKEDNELGYGGEELSRLHKIDLKDIDQRVKNTEFVVACDVDNPLYGKKGAAYVYGPQKGADNEMVKMLDNNLKHFAKIVKNELEIEIEEIPGAGAAGGLGAGLLAFLSAKLKPGIEIILNTSKFESYLDNVDLIFTGEGMIDEQTVYGKTPIGVAKKAKKYQIPVIGLAGSLGNKAELVLTEGIDAVFSILNLPISLNEAQNKTAEWLEKLAEQVMRVYLLGGDKNK